MAKYSQNKNDKKLFSVFRQNKNVSDDSESIEIKVLKEKINELLFFMNQVKNSVTIKTDEYEALTRLFTGQKIYVDTRDISLAPHLMLDGIWEEDFTKIIRKFIKPDTIMFDVGANFGYFGIVCGTEIKSGEIHFFEPNPLLANCINKSIVINGLWQFSKVNEVAVGDESKSINLSIPGSYFGSASAVIDKQHILKFIKSESDLKQIKVSQITLDNYVKDNKISKVDVLKMDIEGYEENAYKGMSSLIKSNPNLVLFIEFTQGSYKNPKKFFKKLCSDFKYLYLCDKDLILVESIDGIKSNIKKDGFAMLACSNNNLMSLKLND